MLLTPDERLLLIKKKESIYDLTKAIIENLNASPNSTFIINNINQVISILSTIASYTDSKSHNLANLNKVTLELIYLISELHDLKRAKSTILFWCTAVNSVEFNFTEKKALFNIPNLDINVLKQSISGFKTGVEIK